MERWLLDLHEQGHTQGLELVGYLQQGLAALGGCGLSSVVALCLTLRPGTLSGADAARWSATAVMIEDCQRTLQVLPVVPTPDL